MTLNVSKDILRKQLTIVGSWTFSSHDQAECARYIARGRSWTAFFTARIGPTLHSRS